jgi:Peptidase S24-like
MESISSVLQASGASVDEFMEVLSGKKGAPPKRRVLPLIGFAKAGKGGFFDDSGFPTGHGWDEVEVPGVTDTTAYALEITGDSMVPVYREGDTIVVSPGATIRKGDRRWPGHGQNPAEAVGALDRACLLQPGPSGEVARGQERRLDGPHHLGQPINSQILKIILDGLRNLSYLSIVHRRFVLPAD